MARWLPDGNIEFLGRKDNQIQLKGIRVELGEIECVLLKQEGVTEAAVVVRTDKEGEKYLRAALVSHQELTIDRLRERLAGELPHYMIPSEFFQLEKMPLTPSGKINRKVIEAIELPEPAAGRENTVYVAPGTPLEAQIADIWKEILNKSKVSIYDNFFDLGGNSLGVIQVNVKLKETLHRDIPALALFEYPTIDALARYLEPKPTPTDSVDEGGDEIETARTEIKSKGRDRMQQRKTKLKEGREERVNQIK
jgi:fengycin family lipopeptide synthetase D